jgi:glucose-1-phosphate thymidylyltransferase
MWGIVPAAGRGSRIQPLGFSKELLPVGSRSQDGTERPRAVSEYLIERMVAGGADKICFIIAPGKSDILEYYGAGYGDVRAVYVVQPNPTGLCDALFCARPVVAADEPVMVGLPDTIWFPDKALQELPDDRLSFLLFPVEQPQFFDAVVMDAECRVKEIQVKTEQAASSWIWGAFKMPGATFHDLHRLWLDRGKRDEYVGTLVNAYLAAGGEAWGVQAGERYADVGTVHGYRVALELLSGMNSSGPSLSRAAPQHHAFEHQGSH